METPFMGGLNRGHRRTETLGKDMPVTSLLLNLPSLSRNNRLHEEMRSDASNSIDFMNKIVEEEPAPAFCPVPNNSPNPCSKLRFHHESDDSLDELVDHKYEILISDSSSDTADDDDNSQKTNPEELVSLVGNSKFYAPCLTCTGIVLPDELDLTPQSSFSAINEMCRRLCTEECRLRLSLAGFVPPPKTKLLNHQLLEDHLKLSLNQTKDIPPELPARPPGHIALQRKQFLNNILNSDDSDNNSNSDHISSKELLLEAALKIIMNDPDENQSLEEAANVRIDPQELEMLKDLQEKYEIAEALAKTTALTSTSQIKQRLAARKLEIERDTCNAAENKFHDININTQPVQQLVPSQQPVDTVSSVAVARHDNAADQLSTSYVDANYEIPRELLMYLVRMGSFNSAPKINNADSQDNNFQLPEGLNVNALLQHVKQLRGPEPVPLLTRYFLKPSLMPIISSDLTDSLNNLKLNDTSYGYSRSLTKANRIRLLQWNLLSQTLGQNNDGFIRCPEKALTWQHRKFLIIEEILQHMPDIICLQEVDHFKFLQTVLSTQNYEGIFFPKPDSPCLYIEENNGPDGCAIFFKRDKYELKKFSTHILEVWRVQSNQVAIAVNLLLKPLNCEICICTTHLKARHGSLLSKLRNEQGRDLLRYVKRFAEDRPVVLCGDFNAEPIEPVYSTILNCDFLNLSSAYADMRNESDECNNVGDDKENYSKNYDKVQKSIRNEPPYTTWKIRENGEECHTIDYVFYSRNQFKVTNCLEFPQENEIGKDRTPSFQYPSDHFSLVCDLELLSSQKS